MWPVAEQTASTCAGGQMLGDVNRPAQKCFYLTFPVEPDTMLLLVSALANSGGVANPKEKQELAKFPVTLCSTFTQRKTEDERRGNHRVKNTQHNTGKREKDKNKCVCVWGKEGWLACR